MIDTSTIIKALRCSATEGPHTCDHACPYYYRAPVDEAMAFCQEHHLSLGELPPDFFNGCDVDRITLDAADRLEELSLGLN